MKKRAFALLAVLVLMFAMAMPTFAAGSNTVMPMATVQTWNYYRAYDSFYRMGVVGDVVNNAPVRLQVASNENSQLFLANYASDGSLRLFCREGYQSTHRELSYTLNVYRSGNWPCTMLQGTPDNRADSEIDFRTISGSAFRIYLPGRDRYLTQNGLNANLTWKSYEENTDRAWIQVRT